MKLNKAKDTVQREALKKWVSTGKRGTCEIATGLGKTFISLHALYTMPKDNNIKNIFLAETIERRKDLLEQIREYNKLFNRDVLRDYNLSFYCYQAAYKWVNKDIGLVIADEIHDSITIKYSKFYFNNNIKAIIGLTAKLDKKKEYTTIYGEVLTKEDILNTIAPICFIYSLNDSIKKETSRKLNINVINISLDNINKNIKAGNKKNTFYQTEQKAYEYVTKSYQKAEKEENYLIRNKKMKMTAIRRATFLYNLPSKIETTKKLLNNLNSKTIVFGNSIDALLKVTPNVVSSRNKEDINKKIRAQFEENKINIIGSFKKLKQGANLSKELDNCIIMSYFKSEGDLIQRLGRLRINKKNGNIFILLTKDTKEEEWFSEIYKTLDGYKVNFFENVEDCIKNYKRNNE